MIKREVDILENTVIFALTSFQRFHSLLMAPLENTQLSKLLPLTKRHFSLRLQRGDVDLYANLKRFPPRLYRIKRLPRFHCTPLFLPGWMFFRSFFFLSLAPFTCMQQPALCQSWQSQLKCSRLPYWCRPIVFLDYCSWRIVSQSWRSSGQRSGFMLFWWTGEAFHSKYNVCGSNKT